MGWATGPSSRAREQRLPNWCRPSVSTTLCRYSSAEPARSSTGAAPLAQLDLRSGDTVELVPAGSDSRPRQAQRPATLRILSGPEEGRTFDLDHGRTTIGRVASNDIVLTDASLSRRHAEVDVDADEVFITDAGSTNGVLVDGKVIGGPTRLGADQPVLVGQTWFVVDHHVGEGWPGTGPTVRFQPSPRSTRQIRPQLINLPAPPEPGAGAMAAEHFVASLHAVTTRLDGHIDAERFDPVVRSTVGGRDQPLDPVADPVVGAGR